jgi:hypothetical protein
MFPFSRPGSLGAGEIIPVKAEGQTALQARHKSRAWFTRDSTNGECCGSASANSMIGGETEAYVLGRRGRGFQSADHALFFVCHVHVVSETALLHIVIYRF